MIAPWLCTISSSVICLIANRASRVTVKATPFRASHSRSTGGHGVGGMRVLMIAPTFLVLHRQQFFLIADRASRITVKAIASQCECTGALWVRVLIIAPTFLAAVLLIADRASRVTVKAIANHSECTGTRTDLKCMF